MNRRDFFRSSLAAAVVTSLAGSRALAALAPVTTDLEAVTGSGGKVTIAKSAVEELRDSLRGALLLPGQPGYDEARHVLNASIESLRPSSSVTVRRTTMLPLDPGATNDVELPTNVERDVAPLTSVQA